jgi:hypothetical protein
MNAVPIPRLTGIGKVRGGSNPTIERTGHAPCFLILACEKLYPARYLNRRFGRFRNAVGGALRLLQESLSSTRHEANQESRNHADADFGST